jgi:hypothetical protein
MNVEIGAEVALFPEKEYINGIADAVQSTCDKNLPHVRLNIRTFSPIYMAWHPIPSETANSTDPK